MRHPVIETGASEWKSEMLPLHQWRSFKKWGMLPVGFEPTRNLIQKLTQDTTRHPLKTSPLDLSGIAAARRSLNNLAYDRDRTCEYYYTRRHMVNDRLESGPLDHSGTYADAQ